MAAKKRPAAGGGGQGKPSAGAGDKTAARETGPDGKDRTYSPDEKYYRLKTKAVDDLVTADSSNSPPVSAAELRKYRSGPHIDVADWLKVLLLKAWFAGVICYFFVWGLSTFTLNQWDHITIIGIAYGLVTNLITNNVLRFIEKKPHMYDRWMMVNSKRIWFLPLDIIYAVVIVICVLMTYNLINSLALSFGLAEGVLLGVEPILFGVFATVWDLVFVGIKQLFLRIVSDARKKAGMV